MVELPRVLADGPRARRLAATMARVVRLHCTDREVPMTATPRNDAVEEVTVAFAVEISVARPSESTDFDPIAYGGEIVRDAISGWGIPVVRIVHLSSPDEVFAGS
jgi:hypothetical protein